MVKFLIRRPVAVFMTTLAVVVLGLVASQKIPTSLLPAIDIPYITVHLSYPNATAREMENNIVKPLRTQLLQVSHVKEINSKTRDGFALIEMQFDYGTKIDYSFLEVNEKIDAATNFFPRDMERPEIIKASATSLPVMNIIISFKENSPATSDFLQFSDFVEDVIKKRIEQLPEVAIADISGIDRPEIQVIPKMEVLQSLNLTPEIIKDAIKENNIEPGDFIIKNGIYQYNFKFDSPLRDIADIKNIYIKANDRLLQLKDIATVRKKPRRTRGKIIYNGKRSISLAIIKQAGARIENLKKSLNSLILHFEKDYPSLAFYKNQDRTSLLQYSINNLKWSLLIGSLLAIVIMFLFGKDKRSPLIIALTIPLSLVISLFFMFAANMSINIISLSGLLLGVGMMIDNSIIVIDNIHQKIKSGVDKDDAIAQGTHEIITPLITSVLTTISVFLPLIFLSGITGALFYEQALAVTIGLGVSLLVSIMFIPVAFRLFYKDYYLQNESGYFSRFENIYEKGYTYFVRTKFITLGIAIAGIFLAYYFLKTGEYKKLPDFRKSETVLNIDWNENITPEENAKRTTALFTGFDSIEYYILSGEQQFVLQKDWDLDLSESKVYIKTSSPEKLDAVLKRCYYHLSNHYPQAIFRFEPVKTVFEQIFGDKNNFLTAHISSVNNMLIPPVSKCYILDSILTGIAVKDFGFKKNSFIRLDFERMLLYDVPYDRLLTELKSAFNENTIERLKSEKKYIPVKLDYDTKDLHKILNGMFITNTNNEKIPVKSLIKIYPSAEYKTIFAGNKGEYLPYKTFADNHNAQETMDTIRTKINNAKIFKVDFAGTYFQIKKLKKELLEVLLVSLLLLYFIMAAQFESFILPLITLLEIPIDIGGALLLNYILGGTINVMTAIGLVVMSGIVINDSILKIHTINMLRRQGYSIDEAIILGGKYRLKAIIMTSLTSILALLPFLSISGMGSELQRPLAIAVIGGLTIGTFISLYFIPLMYRWVYKKN